MSGAAPVVGLTFGGFSVSKATAMGAGSFWPTVLACSWRSRFAWEIITLIWDEWWYSVPSLHIYIYTYIYLIEFQVSKATESNELDKGTTCTHCNVMSRELVIRTYQVVVGFAWPWRHLSLAASWERMPNLLTRRWGSVAKTGHTYRSVGGFT